jgi:hypothetical protein
MWKTMNQRVVYLSRGSTAGVWIMNAAQERK